MVKVLVMVKDFDCCIWSAEYIGTVLAETNDMYLISKNGLSDKISSDIEWIDKDGYFMRCDAIKDMRGNDD